MAGLQPDARSSMDQIVKELAVAFNGTPEATIRKLVRGEYRELSKGARIETYLPVLTKRVVRERLRASTTSPA
jgi:hypothetical protein